MARLESVRRLLPDPKAYAESLVPRDKKVIRVKPPRQHRPRPKQPDGHPHVRHRRGPDPKNIGSPNQFGFPWITTRRGKLCAVVYVTRFGGAGARRHGPLRTTVIEAARDAIAMRRHFGLEVSDAILAKLAALEQSAQIGQ